MSVLWSSVSGSWACVLPGLWVCVASSWLAAGAVRCSGAPGCVVFACPVLVGTGQKSGHSPSPGAKPGKGGNIMDGGKKWVESGIIVRQFGRKPYKQYDFFGEIWFVGWLSSWLRPKVEAFYRWRKAGGI